VCSLSCELHLHLSAGTITFSESAEKEITLFLSGSSTGIDGSNDPDGGGGSSSSSAVQQLRTPPPSRLFVWLPSTSPKTDAETTTIHLEASCQQWPKQNVVASIAFCRSSSNNATTDITHASQIHCVTLQSPPPNHEEVKSQVVVDDRDTIVSVATPSVTSSVLQSLQLYTRECFLPTLTSLVSSTNESSSSSTDTSLDMVLGKMRELDVALVASSRSARLPHVILFVHDQIANAVQYKQGDKMDWDALRLAGCLTDDNFLNTIQSGVSQWIVQIRKITVLPSTMEFTDTSSIHAALEEMTFWTQLSTELQSIHDQLKSPGVDITLAMLRETKRFVATLALENNTGLEQATTITTDVNNFIKTYPLAQLQAARDFDKIVEAMNAIFDHLPKVRQSRHYSLDRSAALLSATTVILRESLLSVLQDQYATSIIFTDYKEYENKIRFPTLDIFAQFDDRFAEWKDFFLDQARRRKLSGMNRILDKIALHHIPLKDRLEQIHEFRHQQERLREVVHTVLREDEPEAIQQVDQAPRQIFATLNVLDLSPAGAKGLTVALEEYDFQMDALEERLARLLRDKLQACQVRLLLYFHKS
jgi:Dynein heavy chain, N-terminal region 1